MHYGLTKRLKLRYLVKQDWSFFFDLHSSVEVNRYVRTPETAEQIANKFNRCCLPWQFESGEWLALLIEEIDSGLPVGITGLRAISDELAQAEVGYLLSPLMQGKGYATESLRFVLDYCFKILKLHKVTALTDINNLASANVLIKTGFIKEGLLRDNNQIDQQWHDDYFWGLLEHEYQAQ